MTAAFRKVQRLAGRHALYIPLVSTLAPWKELPERLEADAELIL
jgi:hypothetical protein